MGRLVDTTGYDIYVMTSIKDSIDRNVYLWLNFYDIEPQIVFERINDYIISQNDKSDIKKDNIKLYVGTLVCMLTILNKTRDKYDFYNYLYHLCVEGYYKLGNYNTDLYIGDLKRDDYITWLRKNKMDKIINILNG